MKKKVLVLMLGCIMSFGVVAQISDTMPEVKVESFRVLAEAGDAQSQFKLGMCYYYGLGIEQNIPEALKWYNSAASKGYAPAQNAVGKAWAEGDFGKENLVIAKKYYQMAISQGYAEAMYNMGRTCVDGYYNYTTEAVKWFAQAAGQGFAPAMFDLGHCYENGYGVKSDRTIALQWYIKASEAGYEEAKEAVTRIGEGYDNDSH